MEEPDIIKVCDEICFGHRHHIIDDNIYCFRPLSVAERNMAQLIYEHALTDAINKNLLPRSALRASALQHRVFFPQDEIKINSLKNKIDQLEDQLAGNSKNKSIQKEIDYYNKSLYFLLELKYNLIDAPSQEYFAEQEQLNYMIFCSTLIFPSLIQLWKSREEFNSSNQISLLEKLRLRYYQNKPSESKTLRQIAKSSYWRLKWLASNKNPRDLFYNKISDMTFDQYQLIHWTHFYDSIYNSIERPPQHIIDDDVLIDEWFAQKIKEQEASSAKGFITRTVSARGNEVGVMVHGYYSDKCTCGKPDGRHLNTCQYGIFIPYDKSTREKNIEAIHASNPTPVRQILRHEVEQLKQGSLKEQELRKSKQSQHLLGIVHKK